MGFLILNKIEPLSFVIGVVYKLMDGCMCHIDYTIYLFYKGGYVDGWHER